MWHGIGIVYFVIRSIIHIHSSRVLPSYHRFRPETLKALVSRMLTARQASRDTDTSHRTHLHRALVIHVGAIRNQYVSLRIHNVCLLPIRLIHETLPIRTEYQCATLTLDQHSQVGNFGCG